MKEQKNVSIELFLCYLYKAHKLFADNSHLIDFVERLIRVQR